MFEKFSNIIEGKFAGPLEKLSNQRHLRAIRDGIIATLPIIIVSSLLMVVAFSYNQMPESWALAKFIKANAVAILLPYRMSMYIMTLYAVFGIGYSLAKSYDLDGLSGAIYLNEYTKNKKFVSIISFTTEVLAGIPSIIYGLFGMLFFGSFCQLNFSILTGSLTLAIMILPIISRNTQTALECVPKSYREAALGIGATKWYMIRTVLLPSAIPGILTGVILAMGRIVAESAALLFTAGSVAILPTNIFGHLLSSGGTLTIQLYLEMAKGNYEVSFVIALVLVVIVLGLNMLAKWISRRFDVNKGDN